MTDPAPVPRQSIEALIERMRDGGEVSRFWADQLEAALLAVPAQPEPIRRQSIEALIAKWRARVRCVDEPPEETLCGDCLAALEYADELAALLAVPVPQSVEHKDNEDNALTRIEPSSQLGAGDHAPAPSGVLPRRSENGPRRHERDMMAVRSKDAPPDLPQWAAADEISDRVIDLVNAKVKAGVDPSQILAGLMLGLLGFMRTAPPQRPESFNAAEVAVRRCLRAMMADAETEQT